LLKGQYNSPIRVVSFNAAEHWSQDVSADVAHKLRRPCDLQQRTFPAGFRRSLPGLVSRHSAAAADPPGQTVAFHSKKPAAIGVKAPFPV
jgi:hypothetical protein